MLTLNILRVESQQKETCNCKELGKAKYKGAGVSICEHNNLRVKFPNLESEWDYERNKKGPEEYTSGSKEKVWWKCYKNLCGCHRWEASISNRTSKRPTGCPYCSNRILCSHNNLTFTHPELCKDWCYERNKEVPEKYSYGSDAMIWWKCSNNPCGCHIYQCSISNRACNGRACPYCSSHAVCPHNNLVIKFPSIAAEWDYERNNKNPEEFLPKSDFMAWWNCPINQCSCHTYQAQIKNRTNGKGCPYCTGNTICAHNNLLIKHPNVSNIWNYERNQKGPEAYASRSSEKVWWNCNVGHIYQMTISSKFRRPNTKCPLCNGSAGEKAIGSILKNLGIEYKREWRINDIQNRRYDFYFILNGDEWIIEYDGEQHFSQINFFHPMLVDFEQSQDLDNIKTFIACHLGYKVIRIDYTNSNEEDIQSHILEALKLNRSIYYSDIELYEWMNKGVINIEMLEKEAPLFWAKINK